jgi:hypothetical protein
MIDINPNELQTEIIKRIGQRDKIIAARCGWGSGKTSARPQHLSSPCCSSPR